MAFITLAVYGSGGIGYLHGGAEKSGHLDDIIPIRYVRLQ